MNQTPGEKKGSAPRHPQRIGRWGESVAAYYIEQRGYVVLARNARTRYGEIDLIAQDGAELVFVEVKTRTGQQFGNPEEAVDARKLEHLARSADEYLHAHPELAGRDYRIDVIAIQGRPGAKVEDVQIEYFENVAS